MNTEADIGALKADMKTVKAQTSKIFDIMDEVRTSSTALTVAVTGHMDRTDTRLKDLETRQKKTETALARVLWVHGPIMSGLAVVGTLIVTKIVGIWPGKGG